MKFRQFIRQLIYNDDVNPLPMAVMLSLFIMTFFDALQAFSMFSYLPHLIKWFGISEVETGKYAGILAAALYSSRIFSSCLWGFICDRYGKKRSLLVAAPLLATATGILSFTTNYYWVLVCKLLQGAFMGIIVISKSILRDVVDDTNQELGFTIFFSAYTIGSMLGPSIGGYMAFPADQYPKIFSKSGFFASYPIFLPNFFIAFGLMISIIIVKRYVPKDKQKEEHLTVAKFENISFKNPESFINISLKKMNNNSKESVCTPLIEKKITMSNRYSTLLRFKGYIPSVMLYATLALTTNGYSELLPVFASTTLQYNGLNMTLSEIGTIYIIPQLFAIVMNLLVIPKIIRRLGVKLTICVGTFVFVTNAFTLAPMNLVTNKSIRFFLLITTQFIWTCGLNSAFTAINIAMNNSISCAYVGIANGLGMSLASSGRFLGPLIYGSMYSWSLLNIKTVKGQEGGLGFPFNQYFSFIVMIAFGFCIILYAYLYLPSNLVKGKDLNIKTEKEDTFIVTYTQITV